MADYNPSIPQGSDNLSNSQVQILNNFGKLNTIFDNDHYTWNFVTAAFQGLHRRVSFPDVTTQIAQSGNASVLFTKSIGGSPQLILSNSVGESQISASPLTFTSALSSNFPGVLPTSFTMNYMVAGSITFFYATFTITATGGGHVIFTLPTVPRAGGTVTVNVPNGSAFLSIFTTSSTVNTSASANNGIYTISGYYL